MRVIRQWPVGRHLPSVCAALLLTSTSTAAQPSQYEILHAFHGLPGEARAALVRASNGALYGLTSVGGKAGIGGVFVVESAPGGGVDVRMLHEFDRADGGASYAALVEGGDGALYGTTPRHGANGLGTIFRVTTGGAFAVLHAFAGPDGARPLAPLVLAPDGNFYGTTSEGGPNESGTVFRLAPGGAPVTLHAFSGDAGVSQVGLLPVGGDALYGTTRPAGGPVNHGSIFRMALDGTFDTVYEFGPLEVPTTPLALGPDGDLYGSYSFVFLTPRFFKVSTSGQLTTLYVANGGAPLDRLALAADGNFYGTLPADSTSVRGSAFRLSPAGAFAILHDFTPEEGTPYAGLTPVSGGFAGVTASGAFGNHGGVFFMAETGATALVYAFTGEDGDTPWAPPTRAVNGALFGTTVRGGARDLGTVYRIWPGGAFSTLHAFSGDDGALPYARLVAGADGYLYGTTAAGGCHGRGTVFRVSPLFGGFSTVHCFGPGEGRVPLAPLLQGSDGNLYGTTVYGGDADWGTIYRVSPSGAFTTLHTFRWPSSWSVTGFTAYPRGPLIESPSGVFYGTTYGYGFGGSAFRMTSDGHVSLIAFSYPTLQCCYQVIRGTSVTGDLTETASGDIYVTGQTHYGNAVLLNASRFWPGSQSPMSFETVLSLGPPGALVPDPPMEGRDGLFYGVASTADGGTGAIYRADLAGDGSQVTLRVLSENEGSAPVGRPVEGPDGRLYGTTTGGGPGGRGVVFGFRPE